MDIFSTIIFLCIFSCVVIYAFIAIRNKTPSRCSIAIIGYLRFAPISIGGFGTVVSISVVLASTGELVLASDVQEQSRIISIITVNLAESFVFVISGAIASSVIWCISFVVKPKKILKQDK